jgi:hypothetical protein
MKALMMKIAARGWHGFNVDDNGEPDADDIRREYERRRSPISRAVRSFGGKGLLSTALTATPFPGFIHAAAQNNGAKSRTRHMSDEELEAAHKNSKKPPLKKKG